MAQQQKEGKGVCVYVGRGGLMVGEVWEAGVERGLEEREVVCVGGSVNRRRL